MLCNLSTPGSTPLNILCFNIFGGFHVLNDVLLLNYTLNNWTTHLHVIYKSQRSWSKNCFPSPQYLRFYHITEAAATVQVMWKKQAWNLLQLHSVRPWTFSDMDPSDQCIMAAIFNCITTELCILLHISWTKHDKMKEVISPQMIWRITMTPKTTS